MQRSKKHREGFNSQKNGFYNTERLNSRDSSDEEPLFAAPNRRCDNAALSGMDAFGKRD